MADKKDPFAAYQQPANDPFAAYQQPVSVAPVAPKQGFFDSALESSGLKGLGQAVMHPVDAISNFGPGLVKMASDSGIDFQKGVDNYKKEGLTQATRRDFGKSIPIVGPLLDKAQTQHDTGDDAGMAGTLAGFVGGMAAPAAISKVGAARDAMAAIPQKMYPRPMSLTTPELSARGLAKALVVPPGAMPNFLPAAAEHAGTVLDYAERSGIPLNSKIDFANAAKGAATETRNFYDEQVKAPYADRQVSVPGSYRGPKVGEGNRATIGSIDDRINAINQELNPNYRKGLSSQTNAANVSDADLIAEKRALTDTLHQSLADFNGISPEDVANLRTRAGKLSTIADEAKLSANTDTTAAGKSDMGRSDIPTGTKMGLIEKGIQTLRGGPEIIGNRMIKKSLQDIIPLPTQFPTLNPPVAAASTRAPLWQGIANVPPEMPMAIPDAGMLDAQASRFATRKAQQAATADASTANQQVAQQEFLKSQALEQAAQDAAMQRAGLARKLRDTGINIENNAYTDLVNSGPRQRGAKMNVPRRGN